MPHPYGTQSPSEYEFIHFDGLVKRKKLMWMHSLGVQALDTQTRGICCLVCKDDCAPQDAAPKPPWTDPQRVGLTNETTDSKNKQHTELHRLSL